MTLSPDPRDDAGELRTIAGALYGALIRARPFVEASMDRRRGILAETAAAADAELLERIDGALADAGAYLPGVTSCR